VSNSSVDLYAQLARPFRGKDLEWRIQRAGVKSNGTPFAIVVPYVTARAIMERLDLVVTPANWQTDLKPSGPMGKKAESGMIGGIGIHIEGQWIWKWDAAQASDIEPVKGSASGALKRAAVQWGMGRDLYGVGDLFANIWTERAKAPKDANYAKPKVKVKGQEQTIEFWWLPPDLPEQAVPVAERAGVDELDAAEAFAITRQGGPTKAQADIFTRLLRSSVFKPTERARAAQWLFDKSSQANIGDQIEWAKAQLAERKGATSGAA
jgi:hypothetical protein